MTSVDQLKDAVFSTLDSNGSLNAIRAKIRADIYKALDQNAQPSPVPSPSNTDLLLNELIREYLVFHHYGHALSVFLSEANQPAQAPFDRAFLARELGLVDSTASRSTPLLYHLLSHAQQQAKHRGEEVKGGAGGRRAESAGAGDGRELLTRSALSGEDEVVPGDRRKSDGPRPLHVDRSTMY